MFRAYFLQMLQEYRKRNAAIISAFQRPEAIASAGSRKRFAARRELLFFQNSQAQEAEYADWSLTDGNGRLFRGGCRLPHPETIHSAETCDGRVGDFGHQFGTARGDWVFFSDEPSKAMAEEYMRRYGADWVTQYIEAGGQA
jgi:hypothetical protein